MPQRRRTAALLCSALLCAGLLSCGDGFDPSIDGELAFEPNRPDLSEPAAVEPYTGDDPIVQEAQRRFPTGLDMHRKVIARTCTPFDGVCHNSKEYPDLRTPSALVATIDAPCQVQPAEPGAVFGRCEPHGDRFTFVGEDIREIEIGYVDYLVAEEDGEINDEAVDATTPGLHIYLKDPVPLDRADFWGDGQFVRAFINDEGIVQDHIFFTYTTRWFILDGGTHLVGQVRRYQAEQVSELIAVGIQQGDLNRDGSFDGGNDAVPLVNPGNPEESYLIARLRGTMNGEDIPGSIMPLANQPLDIPEMLALFCWVEGLNNTTNYDTYTAGPIPYSDCSYSVDPENLGLLGEGVTWAGRISRVLRANCGSCHNGDNAPEGLDLVNGDVYTALFQESRQMPGMKLIEPGDPDNSYLWLKLVDDPAITGQPMPINVNGYKPLSEAQLNDFNTWLVNGATNEM